MKKYLNNILLCALVLTGIASCEDIETRMPDLQEAATLRLQFTDISKSYLNFDDFENAEIEFDLFTVNSNIDSANIYMEYYSLTDDKTYGPLLFKSFTQSDFNSQGVINGVSITPAIIVDLFGLPDNLITGGDFVNISNEVILTDGRKFPQVIQLPDNGDNNSDETNTLSPDIAGKTVQTSNFNAGFTSYVACPVDDTFATGQYEVEFIGGPGSIEATDNIVTLSRTSPIGRSFNYIYYGFDSREFDFILVCDQVLVPASDARLGCGGTNLVFVTNPDQIGSYSSDDDGNITIEVLENNLGACGLPTDVPLTIKLTKVKE